MDELCRITVPMDPKASCRNRVEGGPPKLRRFVKRQQQTDARWAWIQAGKPKAKRKVRLDVIVRRGAEIDEGSVWEGLKYAIDSLFVNCILPDDRPRYLKYGDIEQETGPQFKLKPEVVFIVSEID